MKAAISRGREPLHLSVSLTVAAPAGFTLAFAQRYFQERARELGDSGLALRLPLHAAGGGAPVEKTVAVHAGYVFEHASPDSFAISWSPDGSSAFPRFEGTFSTIPAAEETCRLSLTGNYDGIPGGAFDAVAGQRIARATIGELLERLCGATEAEYRTRVEI
jgi:hypothetical protein